MTKTYLMRSVRNSSSFYIKTEKGREVVKFEGTGDGFVEFSTSEKEVMNGIESNYRFKNGQISISKVVGKDDTQEELDAKNAEHLRQTQILAAEKALADAEKEEAARKSYEMAEMEAAIRAKVRAEMEAEMNAGNDVGKDEKDGKDLKDGSGSETDGKDLNAGNDTNEGGGGNAPKDYPGVTNMQEAREILRRDYNVSAQASGTRAAIENRMRDLNISFPNIVW